MYIAMLNQQYVNLVLITHIVEVSIHLEVNVQIIVPFASKSATVEQNIPVAIGLIRGTVPHIYSRGEGASAFDRSTNTI